jgi:hypothetical protein
MSEKWAILVVYEGAEARDPAMRFCDGLVQRFWPDFTFELSWFDWEDLQDKVSAREAERKVLGADFVIIAAGFQKIIPPYLQEWIQQAINRRGDREGVLVGLTGSEAPGCAEGSATQLYLRKLAHDGGMDYLTAIPQSLRHSLPESAESCNLRATQVTSVLGAILNRVPSPSRLS